MGSSGQRLGQSLSANSDDCREASIRRMEAEVEEMRQVLMANNLKMLAHRDLIYFKTHGGRSGGNEAVLDGKQTKNACPQGFSLF